MFSQQIMPPQEILISQALRLAEEGFPVFPCKSDKTPACKQGFYDATTDPDKIQQLFSRCDAELIGLPTGKISGLLVIDIDKKNGKNGFEWPSLNELPPTRLVATVNGGCHYYFKMPDADIKCSAGSLHAGVDVRGDGGYVIAPPSSGYQLIIDDEPAELTEALLTEIQRQVIPAQNIDVGERRIFVSENEKRLSIVNQGIAWHEPVRDLVASYVSQGKSDAEILALAEHITWPEFTVNQTIRELRTFIDGARRKDWAPKLSYNESKQRLKSYSVDELFALGPPEWLIDRLLTKQGVAFLVGPSGSYKSFLAVAMATHIANGKPFAGLPTRKGRVLYSAHEGLRGLPPRFKALDMDTSEVTLCEGVNLVGEEDADWVIDQGTFELVIIDTFSKATPDQEENSSRDMTLALRCAERISAKTGATVLMITHNGKDKKKGIRGSSALFAGADTVLTVCKTNNGLNVDITVDKQKEGEDGAVYSFKMEKANAVAPSTGEIIPTLRAVSSAVSSASTLSAASQVQLVLRDGTPRT
ncbi:AAA family ATPase, partial [Alphaproteobacteria bacterium LSUCC0719]